MQNRLRLVMGATALLYFGPLLAGLGGFGWAVVPVFAAIFMLWLVIMQPREFPRKLADWTRAEVLVGFGARAIVQILLVVVCFGIGRGIGGVLGSLPPFPLMLPIAISFLAIPLARLIWNPWQADEMEEFLDTALAQIEDGADPAKDRDYADAVLMPINGLPDNVSVAELEAHLTALRDLIGEEDTFEILLDRVVMGTASAAGKRALMVMASDGAALERMGAEDAPMRALLALRGEAELIGDLAARLTAVLREDPDIWPHCPSVEVLEEMRAHHPEAAERLRALEVVTQELGQLQTP